MVHRGHQFLFTIDTYRQISPVICFQTAVLCSSTSVTLDFAKTRDILRQDRDIPTYTGFRVSWLLGSLRFSRL